MTIPKLRRIKVSSGQELGDWLAKNEDLRQDVMLVTCNSKSRDKFVSSEQVREALAEHGWSAGRRYTLRGNLVGHVACRT